jgi:hypothetical protein
VVDAVRRCPSAAPGQSEGAGQLSAGDCPLVVCSSLSSCVSPFRASPLSRPQSQRREGTVHSTSGTPGDERSTSDDVVDLSGFGRPDGPMRLPQSNEVDSHMDSLLVEGIGPGSDLQYPATSHSGASSGTQRSIHRFGRRAFGEEAFYVEFRIVGHRSSLVQEARKYFLCRFRSVFYFDSRLIFLSHYIAVLFIFF